MRVIGSVNDDHLVLSLTQPHTKNVKLPLSLIRLYGPTIHWYIRMIKFPLIPVKNEIKMSITLDHRWRTDEFVIFKRANFL